MSEQPSQRRHYREPGLELNLTPMMNMIAILIPVLLVSIAFVEIANVETQLAGTAPDEAPPPDGDPLNLRLRITDAGYQVAHDDGSAGVPSQQIPVVRRQVSCRRYVGVAPPPRSRNGAGCSADEAARVFQIYDNDALRHLLVSLKQGHPTERSLILSADADVPFEAIIDVIDASRADADGRRLFDKVQFRPNPIEGA